MNDATSRWLWPFFCTNPPPPASRGKTLSNQILSLTRWTTAATVALFALSSSFTSIPARANSEDALAIPTLTRPVTDEANLLQPESIQKIENQLTRLNAQFNIQAAVFIPISLKQYDVESFSLAVVEKWKLGEKGSDRGLLLLIAPAERKIRFEVGYGLEGEITDLYAKRILNEELRPFIRAGKPGDGILAAFNRIESLLSLPPDARSNELTLPARKSPSSFTLSGIPWYLMIFIYFVFYGIIKALGRNSLINKRSQIRSSAPWGFGGFPSGNRGPWSGSSRGGGGGGNIFSGGGGGFGGGGASSDW